MSDGESMAAVTMVRGAPATRYEGNSAGKALRLAAGDEVTVHEEQAEAVGGARAVIFRIERLLSTTSSGQACVYQVRDPAGASFALKVYHGERDAKVRPSEELLARYAALKHPNLASVRAHGYGADGIQEAYDWELLELLEPLRFPLEDGPREAWLEQRLAPALGAAAEALLSAALVHCDIKPANVMQRPKTSEIVLVDIGSLKGVNADTRESVTTLVATTSAYAAPELLRKHVNEKTDAFSIGMTLFEFAQPGSLSSPRDKEVVARISRGQPVLDRLGSAPRLCDLVNGLTRGDLTARWGCEEFRQWVSGKQVVAPAPELSLPVIKWRKQQISTVPALLQVMADEAAFWSMCEDEGDLPHTLRQWVHTLHDETVGAALSRLVKRCLADGEPALGVTAIRRVLVPDGPFSVKGRQFGGTPAGAVDAIRAAGAVPEDVEVALRLWGHDDAEGTAAALLKQLPTAPASDARTKRGGFELRVGCKAPPAGWEGVRFWHRLRIALHGPLGADEMERRAREVILAVPVGTPDGPWKGDIEVAATLLPDSPEVPTIWQVWAAARRTVAAVAFGKTVVADEGLAVLTPAQIRAMWDWQPGKALMQAQFLSSRDAGESDAGVEAVLWESGRRWLVVGGLVLEQPKQLCEPAVEASVAKWLEGAESRRARLLRWVDTGDSAVRPPPLPGGKAREGKPTGHDRERKPRETLVSAFRRLIPSPSDTERRDAAREVLMSVPVGTVESPWRGSARTIAILAPGDAVHLTNWELLAFARLVQSDVCVRGKLLKPEVLQRESREFLESCLSWPPGRSILATVFTELEGVTDGEEAVEQLLRRSGRDWLVVGASEIRELDQLRRRQKQEEILRWLQGRPARVQRLLSWATRRSADDAVAGWSSGLASVARDGDEAASLLKWAHALLWAHGARGVSNGDDTWLDPTELATASFSKIELVLNTELGRLWLARLGGSWSEPVREANTRLAVHRLWWTAGSTKLSLDTGRVLQSPKQLSSLEDCEQVLTSLSGRAWLERNGGRWAAALDLEALDTAAHVLWWEAGGTSLRIPSTKRPAESPADAPNWSDDERNEVVDGELGRAWLLRNRVAVPAQGPESRQLLLWALGRRGLSLNAGGKAVVLVASDFERAALATMRRLWKCWSPLTLGWLQRLVGEIEWTSVELPDDAGAGLDAARQFTAIANRVDSKTMLCLVVRNEVIDWEVHERYSLPDAAIVDMDHWYLGGNRHSWARHHRRPSFSALVELEILHPGIIRSMVFPILKCANSVRDCAKDVARLSDNCMSPMNVIGDVRERLHEFCDVNLEGGVDSYEHAMQIAGELERKIPRLADVTWVRVEQQLLDTSPPFSFSKSAKAILGVWVFCGAALACSSLGWPFPAVTLWIADLTIWFMACMLLLIAGFVGAHFFIWIKRRREREFQKMKIHESLHQTRRRLLDLARLAKLHVPIPLRRTGVSRDDSALSDENRSSESGGRVSSARVQCDFEIDQLQSTESHALIQRMRAKRRRLMGFDGVWQFWVAEAECWYLETKRDSTVMVIRRGVAAAATATIKVSEADLGAMLAGELDPVTARQHQRLTIIGNHGPALVMITELMRRR
jgi:hypothetical protein